MPELYFFVEGKEDKRLLEIILHRCYGIENPNVIKYINSDNNMVKLTIQKLQSDGDFHIMLADRDVLTPTQKKRSRSVEYGIEENNVYIASVSIESWYVAGAKTSVFDFSRVTAEDIDKTEFERLVRKSNSTFIMTEIVKDYDIGQAIRKSYSFKLFYQDLKTKIDSFRSSLIDTE